MTTSSFKGSWLDLFRENDNPSLESGHTDLMDMEIEVDHSRETSVTSLWEGNYIKEISTPSTPEVTNHKCSISKNKPNQRNT